jgi:hypothetical protein
MFCFNRYKLPIFCPYNLLILAHFLGGLHPILSGLFLCCKILFDTNIRMQLYLFITCFLQACLIYKVLFFYTRVIPVFI